MNKARVGVWQVSGSVLRAAAPCVNDMGTRKRVGSTSCVVFFKAPLGVRLQRLRAEPGTTLSRFSSGLFSLFCL